MSSVNSKPRFLTSVRARRITSTRNVCGVCTAHNLERSMVRSISRPSRDSLIVSVTGWAATAAPICRAASIVAEMSAWLQQGRAASWMATISLAGSRAANPFQTESCLSGPPVASAKDFLKFHRRPSSRMTSSVPSRTTMIISSMAGACSNRRQVCARTGQPAISRKSLSTFWPMRVPLPAATIKAETIWKPGG